MKRSQLIIVFAAIVAVAAIAMVSRGNGEDHGSAAQTSSPVPRTPSS